MRGPVSGTRNDRGGFNECTLATQPSEFVSGDERILADGGFMGGPQLLCPLHVDVVMKAEDEEVKESYLGFNEELSDSGAG